MNKIAVITGGGRGIGFELAQQFCSDGYNVVIISRDKQTLEYSTRRLSQNHGINAWQICADLSDNASYHHVAEILDSMNIIPDVLVNNAGFGMTGDFAGIDPQRQLDMVNLNVGAVVGLTRRLLPGMLQRGSGNILNIASTAAFFPGPYMTVYYATKSFVLNFSCALERELALHGINVSVVCPGPVATDFDAQSGLDTTKLVKRKIFPVMSAELVAKIIFRDFKKGKKIIIPGVMNRICTSVSAFIPRPIAASLLSVLNRRN